MSAFPFEIKKKQIYGKKRLWDSIKLFLSTLPDGNYIWPHPEKEKKARSNQQNKYYWGVVCKNLSDYTGYTPEEIHQILSREFLSYEKEGVIFVKSTTKLKTADFETYMEDCRRFAAMNDTFKDDEGAGLYIALPNEPNSFYYNV